MAKKPRPSINDQLAELAATQAPDPNTAAARQVREVVEDEPRLSEATFPRDNVNALPRDHVENGKVQRDHVADSSVQHNNVVTSSRDDAPDGFKRRVRFEKPHASVYAHPKVFKALREIAAAQDCKPHDLYLEGLRHVLRAYGRDFDALNRGE